MFLTKMRNISCVSDTKFVSATNVTRMGKRGNICVRNNESAAFMSSFATTFIRVSFHHDQFEVVFFLSNNVSK